MHRVILYLGRDRLSVRALFHGVTELHDYLRSIEEKVLPGIVDATR